MSSDTGPNRADQKLSGMEQMMLRDLDRIAPSNDVIIRNCDLLRRDLERLRAKPAKPS